MPNAKLSVTLQVAEQADQQCFELVGMIDVDAATVLEGLQSLPAGCRSVVLDFAGVQRVNSMGLAQLLKLFEHWQGQQVTIQIVHANRMIGVLFKMTGLAGYLVSAITPAPVSSVPIELSNVSPPLSAADNDPKLQQPKSCDSALPTAAEGRANNQPIGWTERSPVQQSQHPAPQPKQTAAGSGVSAKLKLLVSVQSSQQMHGWYFFNTYLQRQLGREIHMELVHGPFNDDHLDDGQMDIVFSKPFEAIRLKLQQQYLPIMRPSEQCDEVTLLARADDPRQSLLEFQGGKVVTATQANFVYLLGRFLLEEDEAALADMHYDFVGCDIKSLQNLIKGTADIVFLLSDSYRGLSGLTKSKLRVIDQSETQFAFHLLSLAPHCLELAPAMERVLVEMSLNNQGRQVLTDLGIPGWSKPGDDEINMLSMLYQRYSH